MGAAGSAERHVRRVADSRTLDRLARVGMVCRALLYGLIGVLAVQVAFGDTGHQADDSGAITAVAARPFGELLLWLMLLGFAALAVWQVTDALVGPTEAVKRLESVGRAAFYSFLVVTLANLLLAGDAPESGDQLSRDLTARIMGWPGGQLLVGAVGLWVLGVGGYWAYKGVTRGFLDDLHTWRIPPDVQAAVETLGLIGYAARGVVAGLAGVFLLQAAIWYAPDKARGVDATLRTFVSTAFGPWLLATVAAGLLCFAAYCLSEARWRRV